MPDIIAGTVTQVIDGDTFDMQVTNSGPSNTYFYRSFERIRMANSDAPELRTLKGPSVKTNLEAILLNRVVRCIVQSRDTYGRVVADVEVLR